MFFAYIIINACFIKCFQKTFEHLLQVSSVSDTVDWHVSRVFGNVGIGTIFQQEADDGWITRRWCFIHDGCLVLCLREDVSTCRTSNMLLKPWCVFFSAESNSDSDFPASNGPLSSWSFYHLSSAESAPPLGDLPELLEPAAWGHSGCGGRASLRPPAAPLPSPFCPTVRPRGGADGHGNPPGARWSHAGAAASPSQGGLSGSLQTGRIGQQQTSQKKLWVSVWIGVRS